MQMSKLLLIGVMIVGLSGCTSPMGMNYDMQEPLPTDLSSVKYLYGLTQESESFQVAVVSPSMLAQRARPNNQEYVEEENTEYDDNYDEYDDDE
jgi:hypothetical protein